MQSLNSSNQRSNLKESELLWQLLYIIKIFRKLIFRWYFNFNQSLRILSQKIEFLGIAEVKRGEGEVGGYCVVVGVLLNKNGYYYERSMLGNPKFGAADCPNNPKLI